MNSLRAARLSSMAQNVALLKRTHAVPSGDLIHYVKFYYFLNSLCDRIRSQSGLRIQIQWAEMEKFYRRLEESALMLVCHQCDLIACDLGFPIAEFDREGPVPFGFNWRTPLKSMDDSPDGKVNRIGDRDAPLVGVYPNAIINAIVEVGGIDRPARIVSALSGRNWLELWYRGRYSRCTRPAFEEAVCSRIHLIRDYERPQHVFDKTVKLRPDLVNDLRAGYGREPKPLEVWRVVHREDTARDLQDERHYWPLMDNADLIPVWDDVTCRYDNLYKRAQREETIDRLDTQRSILVAFFGYLGRGEAKTRIENGRQWLDHQLAADDPDSSAKSAELERYEQLRHWVDRHQSWLMENLNN